MHLGAAFVVPDIRASHITRHHTVFCCTNLFQTFSLATVGPIRRAGNGIARGWGSRLMVSEQLWLLGTRRRTPGTRHGWGIGCSVAE
jgi:hypothetical protein